MRSIGLVVALLLIGVSAAVADECPDGYPVDCGSYCCGANSYCSGSGCCPNGTWDSGDGYCVPDGHSYCGDGKYCDASDTIVCAGTCYSDAGQAVDDGCPVSEHIVCGSPVQ